MGQQERLRKNGAHILEQGEERLRKTQVNILEQGQVRTMEQEIQDQALVIATLKCESEKQKFSINKWMRVAGHRLHIVEEQQTKIRQQQAKITTLEKRIAQMKGSTKIQEEILMLKAKRVETEKKIQEEVREHKVRRAEADEKLKERERELQMADEDDDDW
jgi:superfamily II RNA helicase